MVGVTEIIDFVVSREYLYAGVILLGFVLVAWLLYWFFKHVIERIVKKNKVEERIFMKVETPIVIILVLVGLQLAIRQILASHHVFENTINSAIIIVVTFMFAGISHVVINYWERSKEGDENEELHEEVFPLVRSVSKIILTIVAIILILQVWGVQVGTLLASFGVIGIVLGIAFQDTMKNLFGGMSLIMDNSLHKKDVIKLDDGQMGEVVEVNLRSTKIKTFDNDYLIIPNGLLSNSKFINFAQPTPTLRVVVEFGVAYGSDIDQVKEIALDTMKGRNDILKFPKREVRFIKMNEYSLDFWLIFYISNYKDRFSMSDEMTSLLYKALRENGIKIPFPARQLFMDDNQIVPMGKAKSASVRTKTSTVKKKSFVKKVAKKSSKKKVSKKK